MPLSCSVVDCKSVLGREEGLSFFSIPAIISERCLKYAKIKNETSLSKERQSAWIRVLKRGKLSAAQLKSFRVCNKHSIKGK